MDGREREERDPKGTESWLDELSLATKLVFLVIVGSIGAFFLLLIVELFI